MSRLASSSSSSSSSSSCSSSSLPRVPFHLGPLLFSPSVSLPPPFLHAADAFSIPDARSFVEGNGVLGDYFPPGL